MSTKTDKTTPEDKTIPGVLAQTSVREGDTPETLLARHLENAHKAGVDVSEGHVPEGRSSVDAIREPVSFTDENGVVLEIDEMDFDQLHAYATEIQDLLHGILRIGARVYVEFRGTKLGEKYVRATQLVGDEALRQRAEASGIRHSGRVYSASEIAAESEAAHAS